MRKKRTHGSWVIEQLFVGYRSIVRWSLNHCSLEHEERCNHVVCQFEGETHHFILVHAHFYLLSSIIIGG